MNASQHLTEAERHDVADGSAPPGLAASAAEHLAHCEACARDVSRVRELMTRIRTAPPPSLDADLWPDIRARIEREKIVQLAAAATAPHPGRRFTRMLIWTSAAAAAAVLLVLLPRTRNSKRAAPTPSAATELRLAADSANAYEREATILLNELELRRVMLRPQLRSSLDRDLEIIDDAILELKEAIARDPNNPALRRLLAASYKQKIDLLKRVGG